MSDGQQFTGPNSRDWQDHAYISKVVADAMLADDQMRRIAREWEAVQQRAIVQYQSLLQPHAGVLADAAKTHQRIIDQLVQQRQTLQRTEALFAQLPERLREPLVAMAERGWYLDGEMPFEGVMSVRGYIDKDPADVDEQFRSYFRERLDGIEQELIAEFPNREALMIDAFRAHREERYILSIPVLLAQADGMWQERVPRGQLFGRRGPPQAARKFGELLRSEKVAGYRTWRLLWPLFEPAPLWEHQSRRPQGFSGLNRHQVMHGESVDYGTETNGLKAVSFLGYVCSLLPPAGTAAQ